MLTTVTSRAVINIDGAQIGGIDQDGVQVEYDEIIGWHDGAPRRSGFTDRDNADGQFDGPVFKSGRVVTVTGWAMGPSRAAVAAAIHRMTEMLDDGARGVFTVADPDYGTLSAVVRLSDGPQINWNESQIRFMWQFQVTAPDPLKYGPERAFVTALPSAAGGLAFPLFSPAGVLDFGSSGNDGRVEVWNDGTAATWPVYVIAGPVPGGLTLIEVESGRIIQFADDVPAGSVLTIRSATGRADVNGADRSGSLVVSQWWSIPKHGSSTIQFSAPAAAGQAGTLTVLSRDAHA